VEIGPVESIGPEPISFSYPDDASPCFCVALDAPAEHGVGPNGSIVAFSRLCPHMGCPIDRVDASAAKLGPCRCHFSSFDLSRAGAQLQGQAVQDLAQVLLEEHDGMIYAVGLRGVVFG
jgi:arsenite oxidase small subunit